MVHEKRDERQGQTKGYSAGSPETASYSSRCCSNSCDGGGDVELLAAPPRSMNQDLQQVCGVLVGDVRAG